MAQVTGVTGFQASVWPPNDYQRLSLNATQANIPDCGVGRGPVRLGKNLVGGRPWCWGSAQFGSFIFWTPVPANIPYSLTLWTTGRHLGDPATHTPSHPQAPVSRATKQVKHIPSLWKPPTCFLSYLMYVYNAQHRVRECHAYFCTVNICELSGGKLLILSSGGVFGSKLQCRWSRSIIFNPVNSASVTTAPLRLCQAQFSSASALAVQDSCCSQVESDYRHRRRRRKPGPRLQRSKSKIWAIWCLSSCWCGCWCVKRVPPRPTSLVNMRCSIYQPIIFTTSAMDLWRGPGIHFNPSNSFSAPNPFLIQLSVWLTRSQA